MSYLVPAIVNGVVVAYSGVSNEHFSANADALGALLKKVAKERNPNGPLALRYRFWLKGLSEDLDPVYDWKTGSVGVNACAPCAQLQEAERLIRAAQS